MGSKSANKWLRRLLDNPKLILEWDSPNKRTAMIRRIIKDTGPFMILSATKACKLSLNGTWVECDVPKGLAVPDHVPGAHFLNPGSISMGASVAPTIANEET